MFRTTCCHFSRVHRLSVNPVVITILCLACATITEAQTIRIPLTNWLREAANHHQMLRLETPPATTSSIKTVAPADQALSQVEEQDTTSLASETAKAESESGDSDKRPEDKNRPIAIIPIIVTPEPIIAPPPGADPPQFGERDGFQWRKAYQQSLLFLGIQHGFRMMTEAGSRAEVRGPFFRDWFTSVRNVRGWRDGDPFIVNYIGHPMQGAVTGYIQIHNDPRGVRQEIGSDRAYWKSRFKAFAWSAAYSTQFEIGPLSEAALGNVGLKPTRTSRHPAAWVDLVVTPTLGTAWLVGEDALDRWVVRRLENKTSRYPVIILIRSFLNPSRSFANVLRGKWPWYRDYR